MSGGGKGGFKFCPNCRQVRETRVITDNTENEFWHGLNVKRRKIICGEDGSGKNGCGYQWDTLEVIESELQSVLGNYNSTI